MNILALDTCFGACSVAACRAETEVVRAFELRQTGHAEALMPMVERVMAEAGLSFSDLERIAVTTGPGSFTGMRIGVAAARALALATGARLAGFSTLQVMAETARARHAAGLPLGEPRAVLPDYILVAVDARKEQVYAQLFGRDASLIAPAAVLSPQDAATLLPDAPVAIVGSGAGCVAAAVSSARANIITLYPDLQPDAACLAVMAARMGPDQDAESAATIRPLYLRPPDAKPQHGKSIPRLT